MLWKKHEHFKYKTYKEVAFEALVDRNKDQIAEIEKKIDAGHILTPTERADLTVVKAQVENGEALKARIAQLRALLNKK